MPWAPVHPSAVWEGDDDIALSWVRRDKTAVQMLWSPEMTEATESYEIDVLDSDGAVIRALTSTTPTVTYSSADQVTDFGENQKALHAKFKAALVYPIFMAVIGTGILLFLIS